MKRLDNAGSGSGSGTHSGSRNGTGSQSGSGTGSQSGSGTGSRRGSSAGRRITDRLITLILVAAMVVGGALLAYPSFSDYWNRFHQSRAVMTYAERISDMNTEEYERLLAEAREYNESLAQGGLKWHMTDAERARYKEVLSINDTGVMGYISIPKIDLLLPIYHGTDESVLQTSIGHMEESSLPVGGENTHCLLSGHRGLPSAKLFTDLDKIREGDTFTIAVLNVTLTYEVDHIWTVEPTDLSHLTIEEGKDYCTLITCTPYGINTHRLLVRAHRIDNADGNAMIVADAIQIRPIYIVPFLLIPILLLLIIFVIVQTSTKRRQKDPA